jgi:hypothetical protein
VLSTGNNRLGVSLQSQRSAAVSPFLAVINRGFESHAKLDGWLRYLNGLNKGSEALSLREHFQKQRTIVNAQLLHLLEAEEKWRESSGKDYKAEYQEAWDQFCKVYFDYHRLIKDNFLQIRTEVEKSWSTHKIDLQSTELQEE